MTKQELSNLKDNSTNEFEEIQGIIISSNFPNL